MISDIVVWILNSWNPSSFLPERKVDWVFFVLAIASMTLAIQQYIDARKADKEIHGLRGEVSVLQEKLAGAVPRFPDNVPSICELLESCNSHSKLYIMVDFIGYSLYSGQKYFDGYLKSLHDSIRRGVQIRLLVYDYRKAKEAIIKQFPSIADERKDPRFRTIFDRLQKPLPSSENEFYQAMLHAEEDLYAGIKGVEMKLMSEEPPALFWMQDNPTSIVFGFRDEFPGTGFFFKSVDKNLCDQFGRMFERHWNRATDHIGSRW